MADYRPMLTRAVANLPSTSTVATRRAIYERARKAQQALMGTSPRNDLTNQACAQTPGSLGMPRNGRRYWECRSNGTQSRRRPN